jgi:hypothetical protein
MCSASISGASSSGASRRRSRLNFLHRAVIPCSRPSPASASSSRSFPRGRSLVVFHSRAQPRFLPARLSSVASTDPYPQSLVGAQLARRWPDHRPAVSCTIFRSTALRHGHYITINLAVAASLSRLNSVSSVPPTVDLVVKHGHFTFSPLHRHLLSERKILGRFGGKEKKAHVSLARCPK